MLLEPAAIDRTAPVRLLAGEYGLVARDLAFLPVGGDSDNYRVDDARGGCWFVNVKRQSPFSGCGNQVNGRSHPPCMSCAGC